MRINCCKRLQLHLVGSFAHLETQVNPARRARPHARLGRADPRRGPDVGRNRLPGRRRRGGTTGGRSSHVNVFGSSHGASHGPVVPPPSLPPWSASKNSEPAGVKWKVPQLLTPTAPTLRASTFSNVAVPARRPLTTDVAGAVDVDVLEVSVRDPVLILHAPLRDLHDRVVGALEEVVPRDLHISV